MPNVTNVSMTIEERGALFAQNIKKLHEKLGCNDSTKLHIVTHSFAGVDMRAAISMYGADQHVSSLTTVCSPHLGMKLVDMLHIHPDKAHVEYFEKALEAVGISQKGV